MWPETQAARKQVYKLYTIRKVSALHLGGSRSRKTSLTTVFRAKPWKGLITSKDNRKVKIIYKSNGIWYWLCPPQENENKKNLVYIAEDVRNRKLSHQHHFAHRTSDLGEYCWVYNFDPIAFTDVLTIYLHSTTSLNKTTENGARGGGSAPTGLSPRSTPTRDFRCIFTVGPEVKKCWMSKIVLSPP